MKTTLKFPPIMQNIAYPVTIDSLGKKIYSLGPLLRRSSSKSLAPYESILLSFVKKSE